MKLNRSNVESIEAPATGYTIQWDDQIKGFGVRVTSAGVKAYILQKRVAGKNQRMTLGRHGEITAEAARKLAMEHLGTIAKGQNPVAEKRKREAKVRVTLQRVLDDYLRARKQLAPRTEKDMRFALRIGCADWLGKPIAEITRAAVQRRHAKIGQETPATANKWGRYLRALFNFALEQYPGLLQENPVKALSAMRAWYRIDRRQGVLKSHELAPWWQATEELPNEAHRAYFKTLVLTGLRKEEALGLQWQDVDFNDKTLVVRNPKNHRDHCLPMGRHLTEMLAALPRHGSYVFMTPKGRATNTRYAVQRINAAMGHGVMIHDLRRTFATVAESLDVPAYALKHLLNHKTGAADVTGGYLVVTAERLRAPMQKIEDHILRLAGVGESAQVIPLRGKA
jgi:integrase